MAELSDGRGADSTPEDDPLRIVRYFDALVSSDAGIDTLARAAAMLSGRVVGVERRGRMLRYDPQGNRLGIESGSASQIIAHDTRHGRVWIEPGETAPSEARLIVERLAVSVDLSEPKREPSGLLARVIDSEYPTIERAEALARLGLQPGARIRLIATEPEASMDAPSTVVPTRYGLLRATLDTAGTLSPSGPAGVGLWLRADRAPEAWEDAVVSFRLANASAPVVYASDVGAMILLARAYDPLHPHPDVRTLAALDPLSAETLRLLIESDSVRAAAAEMGIHHSSMQARHEALVQTLGYDPRSIYGHVRYIAAEMLLRLTDRETLEPGR